MKTLELPTFGVVPCMSYFILKNLICLEKRSEFLIVNHSGSRVARVYFRNYDYYEWRNIGVTTLSDMDDLLSLYDNSVFYDIELDKFVDDEEHPEREYKVAFVYL